MQINKSYCKLSPQLSFYFADLGGSVGCKSDWWGVVAGLTLAGLATFFHGIDHEVFSLPSASLRWAVVIFWWKNVHSSD